MSYPRFIGLCGEKGSGKSMAADLLVEHFGYVPVAWADKVKEIAFSVYGPLGAARRHFYGTQEDKKEPIPTITDAAGVARTGRSIMEVMGETFRRIDPSTWVRYLLLTMQPAARYVIDGTRYTNEFNAVREAGGYVWEVTKVGGPEFGSSEHESELEWRKERKDQHIVARHGDPDGMRMQLEMALANPDWHRGMGT